ncbi:MAG: polyhydroxyalkanoic acid system family protein [Myxococcaceae bacterium]|jgi:hypothetical protein|nr:polyhydroxyalkanoic acid system family protein [Myxococcaceae bacterium]MCA3016456.1 polyhydroxyalkanoic acid system family protein [Myxococcaceae bacterium]
MARSLLLSALVGTAALAGPADDAPDELAPPPFVLESGARLSLSVGHLFNRSAARERIGHLLAYWAERFGVKSTWRGDRVFLTGRVWGIDIRAVFDVQDHLVLATAHDPGSWLTPRARDYVNQKLRKYLHPTYVEP